VYTLIVINDLRKRIQATARRTVEPEKRTHRASNNAVIVKFQAQKAHRLVGFFLDKDQRGEESSARGSILVLENLDLILFRFVY